MKATSRGGFSYALTLIGARALSYPKGVFAMAKDLDPMEALDQEEYSDLSPEEVTDPNLPDFIAPAKGIKPLGGSK